MSTRERGWVVCLLSMVALGLNAGDTYGQCTDVVIDGMVFSGRAAVWWELDPLLFEPIVHKDPILPAAPITDTAGAQVMIQDMHGGGFVAYGTFVPGTNTWSACVPAGGTYIAMISAPDHNLTSRVYDLSDPDPLNWTTLNDAYLPALNQDLATGAVDPANPVQPTGNLLVYAFEENAVNGAPDWPVDPGLPGVHMELYDPRTGVVVADGYTQAGGPGAPTINTADGLVFSGADVAGLLYLENIPPGEYQLRATPGAIDAAGQSWLDGWYHTYTMEGTQEWEILTFPGDPGTEAGAFIAWFGFVKKVGQLAPGSGGSSISGVVEDADVGWEAPVPGEPPEAGTPLDPLYRNQGVSTNGPVPDAFLVLWRRIGDTFQLIATTDADPVTGAFSIDNVPAGTYNIFFVDKPLKHIFGEMQVAVDGVNPVVIPPIAQEVPGLPLAIIARFGARVRGYVIDDVTGIPINGATVNLRYKAGNVAFSTVTANDPVQGDGWYNFDFLPEIETMAFIDVEPPPGYRGRIVTDTYYPTAHVPPDPNCTGDPVCPLVPLPCNPDPNAPNYDPNCVVPGTAVPVDRNGMNRYVQYYTANYKSDLILEPIPVGVGHVQGIVYNDSLAMGTWLPDGIYDNVEEGIVPGAAVQLLDATGAIIPLLDPVTGLPVTDPITGLPVQDPATLTTSGAFDKNDVIMNQGYIAPGISVPPDEWGGFFSGPMPGLFEFRDVAPGTYTLRLTLPAGFHSPNEVVDPVTGLVYVDQQVTVADGARNDVNFGVHTLVPRAGQLEGGVFDDQLLDTRWYSAFAEEKRVLVGLGVTVRDYLGFQLDTLVQPSAVCYPGTTPYDPNAPQVPYGAICDRPDLGSDVEIDRLVAPGLRLYWGNDPLLPPCTGVDPITGLPNGTPALGDPPCHNPYLFNLELPYTMGQGLAKYEADWSLPVALPGAGDPPLPDCSAAIQITAMSATSSWTEGSKWTVSVSVTVEDPIGPLPGSLVSATWSTGAVTTAITDGNGIATVILEAVEDAALASVTATMTVTPGEGGGGTFNPACGVGDCIEVSRPDNPGFTLCGGPVPVCGDGIIDPGEDSCNCPADAGPPGDADGDGVNDCFDICPGFDDLLDTDGDGVPDGCDLCPADPLKDEPGVCGCGVADTDTDGDGTPDCNDLCPADPNKTDPGNCGCGVPEDGCGVCVPAGVVVASLSAQSFPMEKSKWRAEVTVNFADATCGLPFVLSGGDSVDYNFGGETKTAEAGGGGSSMVIGSETIDGSPMVTFTIDSVNIPGWDPANSDLSITIGQPNRLMIVPEIRVTPRKLQSFDGMFSLAKDAGSCGAGASVSAGLLSFVGLVGLGCRRRRRRSTRGR